VRFRVTAGDETLPGEVAEGGDRHRVRLGDIWLEVQARIGATGPWSLLVDGVPYLVDLADDGDETLVTVGDETHRVRVEPEGPGSRRRAGRATSAGGGQRLTAPMPGRVVAVHVAAGERVVPGTPLLVLEAMKMENEFTATVPGIVAEVRVSAGQAVNAGDLLVVVAPAP
jgi:biotin carboxyl carrier protein